MRFMRSLGGAGWNRGLCSFGRTPEEGVPKRLSDFPSDFVKRGCAQLGIVAASARREASGLAGCRSVRLHGVLGVECSNHSVPTIFFNDLAQLLRVGLFHGRDFYGTPSRLLSRAFIFRGRPHFPPVTSRNVPVTNDASPLASHRMARATSSGWPPRPIGMESLTRSTRPGSPPLACMSV